MEDNEPIVIYNKTVWEYLIVVVKRGMTYDEITLHSIDLYAATAEHLIGYLIGACGWQVVERNKKLELTDKCKHEETKNFCKLHMKVCTDKKGCNDFKRAFTKPLRINEVILEKVAQAKNE